MDIYTNYNIAQLTDPIQQQWNMTAVVDINS